MEKHEKRRSDPEPDPSPKSIKHMNPAKFPQLSAIRLLRFHELKDHTHKGVT